MTTDAERQRLVPKTPTPEMREAGRRAYGAILYADPPRMLTAQGWAECAEEIYQAMVDAAVQEVSEQAQPSPQAAHPPEVVRVLERLLPYAAHKEPCIWNRKLTDECTCGLNDVMAAARAALVQTKE